MKLLTVKDLKELHLRRRWEVSWNATRDQTTFDLRANTMDNIWRLTEQMMWVQIGEQIWFQVYDKINR
jgi:hypothetical protein